MIEVSNPLAPRSLRRKHDGHRIALANIRERLELSYGSRALLEIIEQPDHFQVRVGFPVARLMAAGDLKLLIADDEAPARSRLREMLA